MTVNFTDLLKYCIVKTGQQLLMPVSPSLNLTASGMSLTQIWQLFQVEIQDYGRYFPIEKRFNIYVDSYGEGISYDFTTDSNNIGYVDANAPGNFPFYVSKAIPVNMFGALGGVYGASLAGIFYRSVDSNYGSPNRLVQPTIAPFRYIQPPVLILPDAGEWDVTCHYDYAYNETVDGSGNVTEVVINGLDDSQIRYYPILLSMLAAQFKVSVGLSRRAYTNNRLQIVNDAAKMVDEGNQEYKDARARLLKVAPSWRMG